MKSKAIIGTIIAVGIVVIGAVYFMTSTSTNTTSTNTGLNANNLNNASTTNMNSNSSTATNSSSQTNMNTNSNNANNQNKDIHTSNQPANTNNNQAQTAPAPKPVAPKPTINTGTGDFADIISGANYMSGSIDGTQIVIPLQGGHVVNNMLVLPEYYTSKLNETFTAKIASLGDNNFTLYEYYGDTNTAIFKLKYHANEAEPSLSGTFTHTGSNDVTGISFNLVSTNMAPPVMQMPFYHTNINGAQVTIIPSPNSSKFYEKYSGDSNLFTLNYNYSSYNKNYQVQLDESYNGQKTGEYLLNQIHNTNEYTGVFITKPGTSSSKTYNVTLTGNLHP